MEPNQNMPMDPNVMGQSPEMPVDPAAVIPGTEGQMATPEDKSKLMDLMDQIEEKYREMNAEKFAGTNQAESIKKDLIVEVFKALQDAGVDITNVDSVKQFLDDLESENPDLYEIFVEAFNGLLGAETIPTETAPTEAPTGALGALPGSMPTASPATEPTSAPESTMGGVPSNDGLSGMVPPMGGISGKFPNLAK